MKTILKILMAVILFTAAAYPQIKYIDPDKATGEQIINITPATPLPVTDASSNSYAASKTSGSVDTITFSFTTKKIFIVNDASESDTLYFSTNVLFPAANTRKYLTGEWRELNLAVTKCYVKFNYNGTSGKSYRIEAQ
jgi:hypothetical protein